MTLSSSSREISIQQTENGEGGGNTHSWYTENRPLQSEGVLRNQNLSLTTSGLFKVPEGSSSPNLELVNLKNGERSYWPTAIR